MEQLYRIKSEAVQFFKKNLAAEIKTKHNWLEHYNVDLTALEEVKMPYISLGHSRGNNTTDIGGWCKDNGSHFHFTLHFPDIKIMEHDKFSNEKITRSLMDKIQNVIDNHFKDYKVNINQ